jgi:acetolactate synthase regulatory subunit
VGRVQSISCHSEPVVSRNIRKSYKVAIAVAEPGLLSRFLRAFRSDFRNSSIACRRKPDQIHEQIYIAIADDRQIMTVSCALSKCVSPRRVSKEETGTRTIDIKP